MKNLQLYAFLCLVSLLFISCSVEKRQHLSGYHIEWNSSKKEFHNPKAKEKTNSIPKEINTKEAKAQKINNSTSPSSTIKHTENINASIDSKENTILPKVTTQLSFKAQKEVFHHQGEIKAPSILQKDSLKVSGLALAGFISSIVGMGLILLGVFYGHILIIAGLVLSAIALSQINKGYYKGLGFALTGLILSIITVIIMLFILVVLIAILF